MTCDACQRRLLATENPEAPASEVRRHLARCPACRAYQRRLLRIERHIPLLPIPPSRAKEQLLRQFLNESAATPEPTPAPATLPLAWRGRGLGLRLAGVAAAVVLMACGIYLGILLSRGADGDGKPHVRAKDGDAPKVAPNKQPLVDHLMDCDVRLAEADTPRKRVETLAELADILHRETHTLALVAPLKDLQELASLYEQVIREGVVPRARTLPAEERRAVLDPIRAQLARAESDARRLAPKASASAPLLQIAAAAKTGDRQLRALMEEVQ